jgi:hypothetical protein
MLGLMRQQLADEQKVNWPDDSELLAHLDHGCDYVSEALIAAKDSTMKKKITVKGNGDSLAGFDLDVGSRDLDPLDDGETRTTALPDDFVRFVGNIPVAVEGRVATSYEQRDMDFYYWAKLPHPSSFEANAALPYTREQALLILNVGRIMANNRDEFDVSQDLTLANSISQMMSVTRGGKR